jgi:hypothetical protein
LAQDGCDKDQIILISKKNIFFLAESRLCQPEDVNRLLPKVKIREIAAVI